MLRLPRAARLLAAASLAGACGDPGVTTGFSTAPPTTIAETSSAGSTGSTGSTSSTAESGGASSADSGSGSASTWDMGPPPDFGGQPAGCQGKIDFVFVISSWYSMDLFQAQLNEAFPKFAQIIGNEFVEFDHHIMVVDAGWTAGGLETDCWQCYKSNQCGEGCEDCGGPADYPCDEETTPCDSTPGAGVTLPANFNASNKRCVLFGDNRYIIKEEPDLEEAFTCIATLGAGPKTDVAMQSLTAALQPKILSADGCNAGFLRDEALLVVVVVQGHADSLSPGNAQTWWDFLLEKKGGNPDAIVALVLSNDLDTPNPVCPGGKLFWNPLHAFADTVTHGRFMSICEPSYVDFFQQGADLILDQCSLLVPQ